MPLGEPAPREALHKRQIDCRGYRRDDGRWDIEGHLTDAKTYDFENTDRGTVHAGEPVHEMWLRLTIDDDFKILAVEAATDHGPFNHCGAITPNFQRLVGVTIGKGFRRRTQRLLGGVAGCTHLVHLLGPMATTAMQTILPLRRRQLSGEATTTRPTLLDSCHVFASDSEVVKREWPEFYTGD